MRHSTLLLVLPTIVLCSALASAQDRNFYFFNNNQDSVPIWTQEYVDSLTKEFNLKGLTIPKWPNQEQKELLPRYRYPEYFSDPRLPGIPLPDVRNQPGRGRAVPKRRDGVDIPKFPGWRIEKLKNLARA